MSRKCPSCGKVTLYLFLEQPDEEAWICSECGHKETVTVRRCPECQTPMVRKTKPDRWICTGCGFFVIDEEGEYKVVPELWRQYELHVKSMDHLDKLQREFIPNITWPKMYFNRYFNAQTGEIFMKVGFYDIKQGDIAEALKVAVEEFGAVVKTGSPDLRVSDGMTMDDIKESSFRVYLHSFKNGPPPGLDRMAMWIHFLMNQIGYSYQEELAMYSELCANISRNILKMMRGPEKE